MNRAVLIACFLLLTAGEIGAAPTIEQISYKGWREAYRMTNGEVEIVVVPEIARIMHYSLKGGKNVLWENETLAGNPVKPGEWLNFGGDKAWIWPQNEWKSKWGNWPPPRECGQTPHMVATSSSVVSLTSPVIEGYGVRIIRGIVMAERGTRVEVRTVVESVGKRGAGSWAAWSVTQVRRPDVVLARIMPGSRIKNNFKLLNDTVWEGILDVGNGVLQLDPPKDKSAKVGMDADLLAWVKDDLLFTQMVQPSMGPLLDGVAAGDLAQVFSSPENAEKDESPFVELEFTSARNKLRGRGRVSLSVVWKLTRLGRRERDPRTVAGMIRHR